MACMVLLLVASAALKLDRQAEQSLRYAERLATLNVWVGRSYATCGGSTHNLHFATEFVYQSSSRTYRRFSPVVPSSPQSTSTEIHAPCSWSTVSLDVGCLRNPSPFTRNFSRQSLGWIFLLPCACYRVAATTAMQLYVHSISYPICFESLSQAPVTTFEACARLSCHSLATARYQHQGPCFIHTRH